MPPEFDAPLGLPCRNYAIRFATEKLKWCGYPMVKKFEDMVTRFDTIHKVTGSRTDRQTDTARRQRPRSSIASRGKKLLVSVILSHSAKVCTQRRASDAISSAALIPPARRTRADSIRRTNLRRPNGTSAGIRSDLWRAGRATDRRLIAARWSCIPYRPSGRRRRRYRKRRNILLR